MTSRVVGLAVCLLLAGCRASLDHDVAAPADLATLGPGAAPGNERGPGGFVPRGSARNFYAGAGGRLWYYTNHYYWVRPSLPIDDLWIKGEVVEEFQDLRRWPDGEIVAGPEPKTTVEYWRVGANGRSVRLDNHKDYCLLSDDYTAGAIAVRVTLTLGRLVVENMEGDWREPEDAYVLESRNYSGGGGIGADQTRFEPLASEAVTVWAYEIPWSTHPQRMTRSRWKRLPLPTWRLVERRGPPRSTTQAPVVTPGDLPTDLGRARTLGAHVVPLSAPLRLADGLGARE